MTQQLITHNSEILSQHLRRTSPGQFEIRALSLAELVEKIRTEDVPVFLEHGSWDEPVVYLIHNDYDMFPNSAFDLATLRGILGDFAADQIDPLAIENHRNKRVSVLLCFDRYYFSTFDGTKCLSTIPVLREPPFVCEGHLEF